MTGELNACHQAAITAPALTITRIYLIPIQIDFTLGASEDCGKLNWIDIQAKH